MTDLGQNGVMIVRCRLKQDNQNDLREFGVDTNEPDLFSSSDDNSNTNDLTSSLDEDNDEDDLEIPAFLRRQKN